MSSNISEINENSSESPDLVLSSTLNTYTTDLINFQSAQIEIPSEKRRKDGVNDIKQCSNPPLKLSFTQNRENEEKKVVRMIFLDNQRIDAKIIWIS